MSTATQALAAPGIAARIYDVVARLAEVGGLAPSLPPNERKAAITAVDRAIATLTSTRAALLLAERDAGTWRDSGDPSFESWWARTSRAGLRVATSEVRRADTLAAMPDLRGAVDTGELSVEHVDVVARTGAGASESVRRALASDEGRAELLTLARRMDAGRFAKTAARWSATVDRAGLERGHQDQREARFIHLADTPTGTRITGLLDAMAGHRLRLALEAVAGKPAPDDARSPEQRRADALDAMAGATLASPPGADSATGRRPHISLVMTPETWADLRGARIGHDAAAPHTAPATLDDGTPVPPSELARALCDCELTRIVLTAGSEPVDLGRTVRTYTAGQRRAVSARDGGCLWPGCTTPPRWCEVHHLVWWDRDDGRTAVRDGALACSFHHHEIHRLDLVVTRFGLTPGDAADGRHAAYAIATPGGRVVADGRPGSGCGAPRGEPVRTWVPGTGAVGQVPDWLLAALRPGVPPTGPPRLPEGTPPRQTPLPRADQGSDLGLSVSVGTGSLGEWTSS